MTPKKEAWKAMSRFVRLSEALEYCRKYGIDVGQFIRPEDIIGKCCTCGIVKSWLRMDAGHFIGRGKGGGSGVYFERLNVHLQCKPCNAFEQGNAVPYKEYMLEKYGQIRIDGLEFQNHIPPNHNYFFLEDYYKKEYKKLVKDL